MTRQILRSAACVLLFAASSFPSDIVTLPDSEVVMKAVVGELERSMADLTLAGLPRPYFIQYNAQDRLSFGMQAAYGGLLHSNRSRHRIITSRVRIGSYKLDNTNFGRGFGGQAVLPLDDDLTALGHAIWQMTDVDYKHAVEALTRKQAYLKQKSIKDRPDDFSSADAVRTVEPPARIAFDRPAWEESLKLWSARFEKYPDIQDADVTSFVGIVNEWVINSEGTRLRTADTGVYVEIGADIQAKDGMRLSDSLFYVGLQVDQLPAADKILADIDGMCGKLIALAGAPGLEHYVGPVLFEPVAAGKVFEALLGNGFCARPKPLGSEGDELSLEKKIGLRILPRSFQVYDDPGTERFRGALLAGAYKYDNEGVRAQRVTLVKNGILETLLASRTPTKKIKKTTGHGRSGGFGDARANIGCLHLLDDKAMSSERLKDALLEAARAEGLEFALRIESVEAGGFGDLGDPIYVYKVYVEDGREELIRGMKFLPVEMRSLKHILAAGTERKVYNSTFGIPSSVIAPAVIFEELELTKIEREFDTLPILKSPTSRNQ